MLKWGFDQRKSSNLINKKLEVTNKIDIGTYREITNEKYQKSGASQGFLVGSDP